MKKTLLIILPLLLIVGCSKAVDESTLVERGGLNYEVNTTKPFSGKAFELYDNGQEAFKGTYKDGKRDGLATMWWENGQKKQETTFKYGKKHGLHTIWYENGKKMEEGIYNEHEQEGLWVWWWENGQKKRDGIFIHGKMEGLFTSWYENGQTKVEITFKDEGVLSNLCWDEDGNECECNRWGMGCK